MPNLTNCLAMSGWPAAFSVGDVLILAVCALSATILSLWLVRYSGPLALSGCPLRRNRLPFYLPFLHLALWLFLAFLALTTVSHVMKGSPPWLLEFTGYLVTTAIELVMIVAILAFAWFLFARRLKGFGFDVRTLAADIAASVVNFIAILPLVWLGILVVDYVGKWIVGPTFEIRANEGLDALTQNPQLAMRILMLIFILIVVPVFEELLFRGLIQSMTRAYLNSPWLAIIITSFIFALMHPRLHWLAIFMLSLAIGYSYEKSGSLFRPIFIHILFNTTNVCATLLSG